MYVAGKTKYSKVDLLLKTTYECLLKGIEEAKPGNTIGDIGYVIQKYAESKNFSMIEIPSEIKKLSQQNFHP